jgi:hypothetical protein
VRAQSLGEPQTIAAWHLDIAQNHRGRVGHHDFKRLGRATGLFDRIPPALKASRQERSDQRLIVNDEDVWRWVVRQLLPASALLLNSLAWRSSSDKMLSHGSLAYDLLSDVEASAYSPLGCAWQRFLAPSDFETIILPAAHCYSIETLWPLLARC